MEIKEVKCIWWDGYHNAFTDIIKFRDNYFVCFRHATEHYSFKGEGEIYVLKSTDLENWRLIKKFPPLKDDRDPKFFIFKEKLGVLFFARTDIDINKKILDAY
ncbi:MAG TPA: hypothetical protein PK811_07650, partial [bacterium]|nr:hypothetical protein [bacterium]